MNCPQCQQANPTNAKFCRECGARLPMACPGWEERGDYAEILRLKDWMLLRKGDAEGAEKLYLASLDWARKQRAKSWELRTSTSLAKLWQGEGKRKEALDLLKPVYDWFTTQRT